MKKFKKLIPALAMLLVSATMLGTSTYAWFSMNTQVTATGMQVKATAEDGILICNELDADAVANWKVSTAASYGGLVTLVPTSTSDVTNWYHNKSDDPTDAKVGQAASTYEALSADANWMRDEGASNTGVYFIDSDADDTKDSTEKAYVLLNKFFIKSSNNDAITLGTDKHFYINKVKVTGASSTAALDASLRVAVKIGSEVFIYAPVTGAITSYTVAGTTALTASDVTAVPANYIVNTETAQTTVPAITTAKASTIEADVYIYFEGEDTGCKSANLAETLDTLEVEIVFGITTVSAS